MSARQPRKRTEHPAHSPDDANHALTADATLDTRHRRPSRQQPNLAISLSRPVSYPSSIISLCFFDALPAELIVLILEYIPPRPRFLVAPLVCQRFRRAVPLTVRELPAPFWHRVSTRALLSFVNLEILLATPSTRMGNAAPILGARVSTIVIPQSECHLRTYQCSKLRSLGIRSREGIGVDDELQSVATSLTRLQLSCVRVTDKVVMPLLQDLEIEFIPDGNDIRLIVAHLSQLTSLAFFAHEATPTELLSNVLAPKVTSLSLSVSCTDARLVDLISWVNNKMPVLTSLALVSSLRNIPHVPLLRPSLLTHLSVDQSWHLAPLTKEVAYPNLRSLVLCSDSVEQWQPENLAWTIRHATQLRDLEVPLGFLRTPQFVAVMLFITTLHVLSIIDVSSLSDWSAILCWNLPHLRSFVMEDAPKHCLEDGILTFHRVVCSWPHLEDIVFELLPASQSSESFPASLVQLLSDILEEAERNGVQEVFLGRFPRNLFMRKLRPIFRKRKWLYVEGNCAN